MPLSPDAGMLEDSSALDPFDAAEVVEDQPTLHEIPVWLFVRGTLGMTAAAVALTGMHMYLGFRLITPLPLSPGAATTAWATLTLLLLSLPVGVAAARAPRTELAVLVQWVSYLWTAAFGFLMVGCTLLDAAAWVWPSAPLTRAG
ncbi:MAG TPA: hypothetical protein VEY30_05900, partial [Myxococcaceae bacterium]|nr:hypothetical protein [Myxococcaceae bacterium]